MAKEKAHLSLDEIKDIKYSKKEHGDILCNNCGNSCVYSHQDSFDNLNGLIEETVSGGYFSTHLEDLTSYTFSLCEFCLVQMFSKFKIKVYKEDVLVHRSFLNILKQILLSLKNAERLSYDLYNSPHEKLRPSILKVIKLAETLINEEEMNEALK